MAASEKYIVRKATRKELNIAVRWAAEEGWNPGIHDADCFWAQDPNGFFVGVLNGKVVATVSAVRYGGKYGFLGFYIVKKGYRAKGYGMQLFKKAWQYLGNRNKAGDGVIENLKKYAKIGLKLEHYNARYGGFGTGRRVVSRNIRSLSKTAFKKLTDYDDKVFGFKRHEFLKLWISRPKTVALGYIKNKKILGYGVLRKCFVGYKIGPLFADSALIARELFDSILGQIGKKDQVFFDPPEINKDAVALAKAHKMKKVFATGRIYSKGQPKFPLKKWYGVTSFELG